MGYREVIKFKEKLCKAINQGIIKRGSEDMEQVKVVEFLEIHDYDFTSIPNSTYTPSNKQKIKNFVVGLRPGLCDLLIVLKSNKLLFIEMKNEKGVVSKCQKKWINTLNKVTNVEAVVCYRYEEAIEKILYFEKISGVEIKNTIGQN